MTDKTSPRYWLAGILIVAAASAFIQSAYFGNLLIWVVIAATLASSMRFVLLIGELNFSIAAFFGMGAYTCGIMATIWGQSFWLSLIAGGLVALVVSLVFGYVTLRVKGPYFLLIGFAFTEVMSLLYSRSLWLGGSSGMVGIFPPDWLSNYFPTFVVLAAGAMIFAMILIERSHLGRIFIAIRDNDAVVRSVGIRAHLVKVLCFCIASFIAGLAGALQAYTNNVISPLDFTFMLSTFVLAYLKVGGERHPGGPILGAVILVLLASLAQGLGGEEHIFYGAAIVIGVLFLPTGLMGLAARWRAGRSGSLTEMAGDV